MADQLSVSQISKLSLKPDMGIAQKLQLVQWIEYYNSEVSFLNINRELGLNSMLRTFRSSNTNARELQQSWNRYRK
jgi:hypothetical protein